MTYCATGLLAIILLCSSVFAGEESPQALEKARKKMELLLRKGEALEKKGDLDGALRAYEEAAGIYDDALRELGQDPRTMKRLRGARAKA